MPHTLVDGCLLQAPGQSHPAPFRLGTNHYSDGHQQVLTLVLSPTLFEAYTQKTTYACLVLWKHVTSFMHNDNKIRNFRALKFRKQHKQSFLHCLLAIL